MLRDRGLARTELVHDVRHARSAFAGGRAVEQKSQDVATRAVRDHVEDVRHVLRLVARPAEYHDGRSANGWQQRGRACRRAGAAGAHVPGRRRSTGCRAAHSSPARGWGGMFDRFRNITTSSPARFAVVVFVTLILVFTGLLSLPAATTSGQARAARRRGVHGGLDHLRHRPVNRRHRDVLLAVRQGHHLARRQHRRHGRADARVDPRSRDLQAPGPAGEAHRRERHQSAPRARRSRQRGSDRAARRGRPAAAHRRAVDAAHRGARRRRAVPLAVLRRHPPLDAIWEAPFYAAMAFTNTGFTPNPGGLGRSPTTTSC